MKNQERQNECRRINNVLPSNSLREIAATTNLTYTFVYRVMNGQFKVWSENHEKVLCAAENLLKDAGITINSLKSNDNDN